MSCSLPKPAALAVLACALSACGATGERSIPLFRGEIGHWRHFEVETDGEHVCYIVGEPMNQIGDVEGRGTPGLLVSKRPKPRGTEVSVQPGYEYLQNSTVEIIVDDKTFSMFTRGESAWTKYDYDDAQLIEALRQADKATITVKGVSSSNVTTTDTYSLLGFDDAYKRMLSGCAN